MSYSQAVRKTLKSQEVGVEVRTFAHTSPTVEHLRADSTKLKQLYEKSRNGTCELYERVAQGNTPTGRVLVCLDHSKEGDRVPDSEVKKFCVEQQLGEEQHLQMMVGDLLYQTDRAFVKALNKYLEKQGSQEVEFYHVSEAATRLDKLRNKKSANGFQKHLESFATFFGISANAFDQWQAVMDCKGVRDYLAHPVRYRGVSELQEALDRNSATLQPCKDAVSAMITMGKRFNVL